MVTAYLVGDEILESSQCQFLALAFELVNFDKKLPVTLILFKLLSVVFTKFQWLVIMSNSRRM